MAIIEPDYFANRKLVEFFDGELVPVPIHWKDVDRYSGLDLEALEKAFQSGVKVFLYSNPNNPTGVIYSPEEVAAHRPAGQEVQCGRHRRRAVLPPALDKDQPYTHLRALEEKPDTLITIIGPSKTESLSGFRLGVAYGSAHIITRMEKLQAIVSLRTAGYCQSAYLSWFSEPDGWMEKRVADHKAIRDDLLKVVAKYPGCWARPTEGGSYIFLQLPALKVTLDQFVKLCRLRPPSPSPPAPSSVPSSRTASA